MLRLFLKMGGWIVVGIGLMLLVLSLIGQSSLNASRRFDDEGRQAVAQVTQKRFTKRTASEGKRTVTY